MAGKAHRLAGIGHFGLQEVIEAPIDLIAHRVQQLRALGDIELAPGPFERSTSRTHRGLDFRLTRLAHLPDQTMIDR